MKILSITPRPGPITNINQNNGLITIIFSEPVDQILSQNHYSISDNSNYPRIKNEKLNNTVIINMKKDLIAGLYKADKGSIFVNGSKVTADNLLELRK